MLIKITDYCLESTSLVITNVKSRITTLHAAFIRGSFRWSEPHGQILWRHAYPAVQNHFR